MPGDRITMSNYHVMEINDKEDQATVAFHIAVPDEANAVSVNLRTAVLEHLEPDSVVPFIGTSERTQIQAGEIYEHVATVEFNAHLTVAEKRTIIDDRYTALNAAIPDKIRNRYRCFIPNRRVIFGFGID